MIQLDESGLTADLGGDVVVRQTRGGEDGNLLPTSDGIHPVDRGNPSLNHLLRVHARPRVDRLTLRGVIERANTMNEIKS